MSQFTEKELNALEHVLKHKNLEPYFFEKLIEKRDVKWLELLKIRGFFDKTNIPILSEGNYIEEWNVLNYVISIMDEVVKNNDDENISYILMVLLQAAEVSKNYRVFYQSIDIIRHIPLSKISNEYLNTFLDYWLSCEFGIDFILNQFESELLPYLVSDSAKALLAFEKFFKAGIRNISQYNYVLNDILENKELLYKIFSIDPKKISELFIRLLEKESFVQSSTREIRDHSVSIQNIDDKIFKISYNNSTFEKDFESRENDINFIINNLKPMIGNVSDQHLNRQIKLLYGDLFNKYAFESIFDIKDYIFDAHHYLIEFIKVCLTETTLEKDLLVHIVIRMLKSNYDIIKKLSIFVIVQKWNILKCSFLNLLETEVDLFDYIFRSYIFDDETKHLFELLDDEIGMKYIMILDDIINKNEYIFMERDDQYYDLRWRQKRYQALRNVSFFQKKLIEAKQITGIDIELYPAIKFTGVHWVEQMSPYSSQEIIKMPINELITKMKGFRETEVISDDFKEISYRGFGTEIKNALIGYPDHFINDLKEFNELQYEFIYYLLDGFSELVKQNVELDYRKVIEFLILYTAEEDFWKDKFLPEQEKSYLMTHIGVLKKAFDFIIDLVSNDKINFTKAHCDLIINFMSACFGRINFALIEDRLFSNNDISLYSLNSLGGRYVKALLEVALKIKRVDLPNYELIWEKNIKSTLEHLMNNFCIDSYIIFGEYIANFSYVDEKWTKEKLKSINPDHEMWQYLMTGYLSSRVIYFDFYQLMGENYCVALEYKNFIDKNIKEKLGHHIIIGYINGFEEKTGNLLTQKLLEIWDVEIIEVMIRYCFNIKVKQLAKGVSKSDAEEKILKFWNKLIDKYSKETFKVSEEDNKLIKEAIHLINNFSIINESIFKNLTFSFKYVFNSYESHYVVDYCDRLINNNHNQHKELTISLIFELLNQCVPSYPEEKIKNLLNYLKENNELQKLEVIQYAYLTKTKKSFVVDYISEILKLV
jgi:hypothetical protein